MKRTIIKTIDIQEFTGFSKRQACREMRTLKDTMNTQRPTIYHMAKFYDLSVVNLELRLQI